MSGGKKPKKGPFNGYGKVYIGKDGNNEKYNYGFRNKKCIKLSSDLVSQISGKFVNDTLEGEVKIHYFDETIMKGFAQSGHLIGPQRFFDVDETVLTNLTDTQTRDVYVRQWNYEGKSISVIGCQNEKEGLMSLENVVVAFSGSPLFQHSLLQ